MSKRTKKYRKNVARGRSRRLTSLRTTSRRSPASPKSNRRTPQSARTKRRVQINTPENVIREYTLGSSEKEWKQKTPIEDVQNCKKHPKHKDDFPCKKKNTVFKNKKSYDEYKQMKIERNESVGYKSKSQHYDDIESMLMSQGYNLLR